MLKKVSEAGLFGYKNRLIFAASALTPPSTASPGPPAGDWDGKTQEERGAYAGMSAEKTVCTQRPSE